MKNITILSMAFLVFCFLPTVGHSAWEQWRRDSERSGLADLVLDIDVPGTRWSVTAGGAAVGAYSLDLDGDGAPEVLSIEGGKVVARSMAGDVYWDSPPILARSIVNVTDLNQDGTPEVVVDIVTGVVLLDASSGTVVWKSSESLVVENICTCLVEDVLGTESAEMLFADCAMNASKEYLKGTVHLFSFEEGFGSDLPISSTEEDTRDYEAGVSTALADVDGDGVREIIAAGAHRFYAYDPATGALEFESDDLSPVVGEENLAQSEIQARDLDEDGTQELIVLTNNVWVGTPSRRVLVLEANDEGGMSLLWTDSVNDTATDVHVWPKEAVGDVDGDGALEVVGSHWTLGEGWETRIYDGQTGEVEQTISGEKVLELVDPSLSGTQHLLTVTTDLINPGQFAVKKIIQVTGPEPEELFVLGARLWVGPFDAAFSSTAPGEIFALWDTNEDDWGDHVGVFSFPDGELLVEASTTDIATQVKVLPLFGEGGALVFHANGEVAALDRWLALRNDFDVDGHGDLTYGGYSLDRVAVWGESGETSLVAFPKAGGRIAVVDGSTGNPFTAPDVVLEIGSNLSQIPVFMSLAGEPAVVLFGRDLDRQLIAKAVHMDGTIGWNAVIGGMGGTYSIIYEPLVADVNTDGHDDLVLLVGDSAAVGTSLLIVISGLDGQIMWEAIDLPTAGGGVWVASTSQEGKVIHLVANKTIYSIDGATGNVLSQIVNPANHYYGLVHLVDLDGAEGPEILLTGTTKGACALSSEGELLWTYEPGSCTRAPATLVHDGTQQLLYLARYHSPIVDVLEASSGSLLQSFILAEGELLDASDESVVAPDGGYVVEILGIPDIVGNDVPGVLISSSDGYLYAFDTTGNLRWSNFMEGALGSPAIFDADGDGTAEIGVPVGTGHLVIVERSVLPPPEWVYENDGSGLALTGSDDVDEKEGSTQVHVNWAPVEGATGYTARLFSAFGTLIDEEPNITDGTAFTFTDLNLQIDQTYYTSIRPLKVDDGHAVAAGVAISDGVKIVDLGAPEILSFEAIPATLSPGDIPAETVFQAEIVDSNALALYRVEVLSSGGVVMAFWEGEISGQWAMVEQTWDGSDGMGGWVEAGLYTGAIWVQDVAGKSAQATTEVFACSPPMVFDTTKNACVEFIEEEIAEEEPDVVESPPDVDTTNDSEDADAVGTEEETSTEGSSESGCSCDQGGTNPRWDRALWWWFVLFGVVFARWSLKRKGLRERAGS